MINLSEVGGLYLSTPANIRDARTKAFMYACDRQIKKLLEYTEKVKVWCAIESVDEKYLDYMAADSRTLFYNSSLAPDVKRKLIANSQYWYMKLGTSAAMEEMINIVLQKSDTSIEEWYSYGGKPYRFRIVTSDHITKDKMEEFLKYIKKIKNARSIFDSLTLRKSQETKINIGCAREVFIQMEIGINPYRKSLQKDTSVEASISTLRQIIIEYNGRKED